MVAMARRGETRHAMGRKMARPLLFAFALFYLCFHAISGERGVYAWLKESRKLEAVKLELEQTTAQRAKLEHKVKLLSSDSLDLDLLDEQARKILGYGRPSEAVILVKK